MREKKCLGHTHAQSTCVFFFVSCFVLNLFGLAHTHTDTHRRITNVPTLTTANGASSILLEHVGEARVNFGATPDKDVVCGFDVSFNRLGFGLHNAILPAMNKYPTTIASENATIVARCNVFLHFCPPGPSTNFNSFDDCYNYFASLQDGGWDYADQQNRGCAFNLHAQMVTRRPDVHCPHVGPTGGTFCVAHANNDEVSTRDNVYGACNAYA